MTESPPTVGDLVKAKAITPNEIEAAVEAVLNGRTEAPYHFADGWSLDLAEAVNGHPFANRALEGIGGTDGFQRIMARTAILMGWPEKA